MGIIAKQSFYNSLSIALAFLIGAINTVYLYPTYMGSRLQDWSWPCWPCLIWFSRLFLLVFSMP